MKIVILQMYLEEIMYDLLTGPQAIFIFILSSGILIIYCLIADRFASKKRKSNDKNLNALGLTCALDIPAAPIVPAKLVRLNICTDTFIPVTADNELRIRVSIVKAILDSGISLKHKHRRMIKKRLDSTAKCY